jgi:hypothetical protein
MISSREDEDATARVIVQAMSGEDGAVNSEQWTERTAG